MNTNSPVIIQGISAGTAILLVKAFLELGEKLGWWTSDAGKAWADFLDVALPILAIAAGTWWASRKTTSLENPRDVDGVQLTRPDNTPAIPQIQAIQAEAIKLNDKRDEGLGQTRGLN